MSWIADIAGRAENLLNNIDKNAANVLQQTSSRLGEEWSSATTKIVFPSSSSSSDINQLNIAKVTNSPLVKNVTTVKYETDSTTDKISSSNSLEDVNENLQIIQDESPQKINNINEQLCDHDIISSDKKQESSEFKTVAKKDTESTNTITDDISNVKDFKQLDQSEDRIQHLEDMLKHITSERDDKANKLNELTNKNNIYINTISELDMNLKKIEKKYMDINEKLGWQIKETAQINIEFDKYRKKAQSTLQIKDKIIGHLKNSSVENQINKSDDKHNDNIIEFEMNSLKEENIMKTNELQDKINEIDKQKSLIKNLEIKISNINSRSHDTVLSLTNRLKLEQDKSIELESQIKVINQEILAMRQQFNKQNQTFSRELHQKDKEIKMLQSKVLKMNEITELNSTEGKMKSLTQVLFEKQAAIETLTIERNALKLQLEKVEEQLRCVISINRPQRIEIVNVNDTDDVKLQLPLIMKETPFDTQVARRVKRAYTSFDSAGIRIGVFLRRYPLVRIMVFVYVAILHIWVMFVLLSSTPT